MNMEQVTDCCKRGYVTVNLDHLEFNIKAMRSVMKAETKFMAVIKTDGYGHGAVELAREMEQMPEVWGYANATVEEAMALRKAGVQKPILILSYTYPYAYETMIRNEIRPVVFQSRMPQELSKIAVAAGLVAKIHIKVDTGMSRIGITPDENGLSIVKEALSLPGISVEGLFTHFAKADETDKTSANSQYQIFTAFADRILAETGVRIPMLHCSNSAGILEMGYANMDMVRGGITLYGLWPSGEVRRDTIALKPLLEWKSSIVYIKELEPGKTISYGGTYVVERPMKVATVSVGYGDGYPRQLSGKGYVLIRGKKVPILGRICMDQFMVDVTDLTEVAEGDVVTLIGRDGDAFISMEELGELSGRFNYELACDIGKRMPRIYLKKGQCHCVDSFYSIMIQ